MKTIRPKGRPIIQSKSCDIYLLDDRHVLKLFHDDFSLEDMRKQAVVTHAVHATGLPVPSVDMDIVVHADNGRNGLVFERVCGEPLLDLYMRNPVKLKQYARLFTDLHKQINQQTVTGDLPLQKKIMRSKIQHARRFSLEARLNMTSMLKVLPDGNQVCHGNLHPGNIVITDNGPMVLDWKGASRGNPMCDIARSWLVLCGNMKTESLLIKAFQCLNRYLCLKEYRQKAGWNEREFRHWLTINAAVRVQEKIPETEKRRLYRLVMRNLPAAGVD